MFVDVCGWEVWTLGGYFSLGLGCGGLHVSKLRGVAAVAGVSVAVVAGVGVAAMDMAVSPRALIGRGRELWSQGWRCFSPRPLQ